MNLRHILSGALLLGAVAATAGAQDTTAHKPGGLNKIAHNVSKTLKRAGRDTKAETHRDASAVHRTLKKGGNDIKGQAARTTDADDKAAPGHKPGGLNKAARKVSHAIKHTGRKAKHGLKHAAGDTHRTLKRTGNAIKDTTRKP